MGVIIRDQNPKGIIYILDTNDPETETQGLRQVLRIFTDLMNEKPADTIDLSIVIILINKADEWSQDESGRNTMIHMYRNEHFASVLSDFSALFGDELVFQIDWCAIGCTEYHYRVQNDAVLRAFATVLARK